MMWVEAGVLSAFIAYSAFLLRWYGRQVAAQREHDAERRKELMQHLLGVIESGQKREDVLLNALCRVTSRVEPIRDVGESEGPTIPPRTTWRERYRPLGEQHFSDAPGAVKEVSDEQEAGDG